MKKYWSFIFSFIFMVIFIGVFFLTIVTQDLYGIPAFARKYKMSCNVCHSPFPRLKPFGAEFAANGFVLKDQEPPRAFRETGDDTLSLLKELPFAIRLEGFMLFNNGKQDKLDFAAPYVLKLLSGGSITKNISYYFYFFFGERGKVAGLEDAFVVFSDVFKSGISITAGQFQVSDPLFKRELRLTFEDYNVYGAAPGVSRINLTYDRGLIFNKALKGGTDITLEILNGSGIEEADAYKNFDSDKYKNVFGRISQEIGERFRIGGCGYYGKEAWGWGDYVNRVWMFGVDASFTLENFQLNAQYLHRNDDNPQYGSVYSAANSETEIVTRGGFVEAVYTPDGDKGKWYAVGLFNWVDSDDVTLEYQSVAAHLGVLLRRNIRIVGELAMVFKSDLGKYARAGIGLIAAL